MIQARIKFHGSVHDVVRSRTDVVELPDNATAQDLITALIDRHGEPLAGRILTPDGKLRTFTRLFVNGNLIEHVQPGTILVNKGDAHSDVNIEIFVMEMTMGG